MAEIKSESVADFMSESAADFLRNTHIESQTTLNSQVIGGLQLVASR